MLPPIGGVRAGYLSPAGDDIPDKLYNAGQDGLGSNWSLTATGFNAVFQQRTSTLYLSIDTGIFGDATGEGAIAYTAKQINISNISQITINSSGDMPSDDNLMALGLEADDNGVDFNTADFTEELRRNESWTDADNTVDVSSVSGKKWVILYNRAEAAGDDIAAEFSINEVDLIQ